MTALNKQALRELIREAGNRKIIVHAKTVSELLDELEAAEKRIAEQSAIVAAAERLVRCKGRYHSEQNYRALAALFGVTTPELPPLEHENVHFADAAEMEIAALRQRINELEARTVTLPDVEKWRSVDAVRAQNAYKVLVSKVLAAAGIGVKGK